MTDKAERLADTATSVRPYVERALKDDELRENVRQAFQAAREVYSELSSKGRVSKVAASVATDPDVQENLQRTIEELRRAAVRLQRREEEHASKHTALLLTGIALGVLFNPVTGPQTRAWLRDALLGPDEEFEFMPQVDAVDASVDAAGNGSAIEGEPT